MAWGSLNNAKLKELEKKLEEDRLQLEADRRAFDQQSAEMKRELDNRETEQNRILDKRDAELKNGEADLEHRQLLMQNAEADLEQKKAAFRELSQKEREEITAERQKLEEQRQEIIKLEAEAKSSFAETQRETFETIIATQLKELDSRQKNLDSLEAKYSKRMEELHALEGEIAQRTLAVTEREQKADAGFADKTQQLALETQRQTEANQEEARRLGALAEQQIAKEQELEKKKAELVQREQALLLDEQRRDAGYADELSQLDQEMNQKQSDLMVLLQEKRQAAESELMKIRSDKLAALETELAEMRETRLKDIVNAENRERERIHSEIAAEQDAWKQQKANELEAWKQQKANEQEAWKQQKAAEQEAWEQQKIEEEKLLKNQRDELDRLKGSLSNLESGLTTRQVQLELEEKQNERKESSLADRISNLDLEVDMKVQERYKAELLEKDQLRRKNDQLGEMIQSQMELMGTFEALKQRMGGRELADVLAELNQRNQEVAKLQEELASRPTEDVRKECRSLEKQVRDLKGEVEYLLEMRNRDEQTVVEGQELRRKNAELEEEMSSLERRLENSQKEADDYKEQLSRYRLSREEQKKDFDKRVKDIEIPVIEAKDVPAPSAEPEAVPDEIEWLDGIWKNCADYGLQFNKRILYAFHTSLKSAEWSPLTVLAGVSGTGKSELPRWYANFGGFCFLSLSVQPNWDSQESMLGFFNSIDNRFDAQPVLRLLAQSQKPWTPDYPGLDDTMCIILLDEMNLAHPELYFAGFLSKLEQRRGTNTSKLECLDVSVGAGLESYKLPLGRNVLWTGTMNQDETTHSLSDKVLDRSIVINFPRPKKLVRRNLKPIPPMSRRIKKSTWKMWHHEKAGRPFTDEEIQPYKAFLEEMNDHLAVAGRAIGHRVWQSVEHYMANYPTVIVARKEGGKEQIDHAMHIAFEDQLVQKVMPKLRGIDTRGISQTECLDPIQGMIDRGVLGKTFQLAEDFDLARRLGYGQFIWQTANYLNDEQE